MSFPKSRTNQIFKITLLSATKRSWWPLNSTEIVFVSIADLPFVAKETICGRQVLQRQERDGGRQDSEDSWEQKLVGCLLGDFLEFLATLQNGQDNWPGCWILRDIHCIHQQRYFVNTCSCYVICIFTNLCSMKDIAQGIERRSTELIKKCSIVHLSVKRFASI